MLSTFLPHGLSALVHSLRFKWVGEPLPDKCIVAFWHSQMIAGWWVSRKDAVALVSQSKDGNYLNRILTNWGYDVVRGSSSKSGQEALQEAIGMIKSGSANRIVITPDGPRGPKELFKRGIFIAALELELPLYFLSIQYQDGMHLLKSWDQFQIPYPLSSVNITAHRIRTDSFPTDQQEQTAYLETASEEFRSSRMGSILQPRP